MYAFGFTINTLTLLAMVLAIGLVVDDAIVVLENIYRNVEIRNGSSCGRGQGHQGDRLRGGRDDADTDGGVTRRWHSRPGGPGGSLSSSR